MASDFIFISESVTEGHPDKLCDQISDAIVDRFLDADPLARVSAECAVARGVVFLAVRYAASASLDLPALARRVIAEVGYDSGDFNASDCSVMTSITALPDSERCMVDELQLSGADLDTVPARDQVTVFGYACRDTAVLMPMPIYLAHRLARRLALLRLGRQLPWLSPDGKTQVAVRYHDSLPQAIHSVTIQAGCQPTAPPPQEVRDILRMQVVAPVLAQAGFALGPDTTLFLNPEPGLPPGGPAVHAGLTGRKNAIDTYGEFARHSGAALSGKDPGRIDRTGAYAARHAAKAVVAGGLAQRCEVMLSYSIGQAEPVSVHVDSFGTGLVSDDTLAQALVDTLDLRVGAIVRRFKLRHLSARRGGFYRRLAAYGHLGRTDIGLPWEQVNDLDALRRAAGLAQ